MANIDIRPNSVNDKVGAIGIGVVARNEARVAVSPLKISAVFAKTVLVPILPPST